MKLHLAAPRRLRIAATTLAVLAGGLVAPQSSGLSTTAADVPDGRLHVVLPGQPIVLPVSLGGADTAGDAPLRTPTGTRLSRQFRASAASGSDLPDAARRAYERAVRRIERTRPGCDLPWGVLAGIGRVESDHGRYGGSRLGTDGVSRPLIRGVALNGVGPVAAIADTDGGRLDGDRVWDRAVGPMQFIPSTWATAGADGDGDGTADPNDLDDAALAAAGYLCPPVGPIGGEDGIRRALFSYNHSDYYVDLVYAFALGYHTGVFDIPSSPVEPTPAEDVATGEQDEQLSAAGAPRGPRIGEPARTPPSASPTPDTPQAEPAPEPTRPPRDPRPPRSPDGPSSTPSPTPSPSPPPVPVLVLKAGTGAWTACGDGWCLAGYALDLGPAEHLAALAAADLDRDGAVETNRAELDGLVGTDVTIQTERGTAVVYTVNGAGYRNADGSFA